jgi:hypothetical protein
VTKELNRLKNKTTKAAKNMKESEWRCMVDDEISECSYQERHGFAYDDYRIGTEQEIKTGPKSFFLRYVDLKKKRVGYPSVMDFEGHSGSGSQEICDLLRSLWNEHMRTNRGCHRI